MELASRAMDQVFEEMYEEGSEAFKGLLSVYFRKKKDDALKAVVREIHAKARGLADYREKLAAMGGADAFAEVCASLFSGYAARLAVVREGLASRAGQYAALGEKAVSAAQALVDTKSADSLLSLFVLGIYCGMLMYLTVALFRRGKSSGVYLTGYIGIFLCIALFIQCGFEHSIADMFYYCVTNSMGIGRSWLVLLMVSLGNAAGAMLIRAGDYFLIERPNAKQSS